MVRGTSAKTVGIVFPQAIKDNTEFVGSKGSTPVTIDSKDFGWVDVFVMFGAMDIKMATMKLYYSNDDSTYTAVTGGNFGSPDILPTAADDNHIFAWHINKANLPYRYWQIELIPGDGVAGTFATSWASLSRAAILPSTATDRGLTAELSV